MWRIIDSGPASGAVNMAVDEAIMREYIAGRVPPTIRFYAWRPAAVSLGYAQRAQQEIDFAACRQAGIDVVRRLTGGRAVLHDAEVTYSVVVNERHPLLPATITGSYQVLSRGLVAGLRLLGVAADMVVPAAAYGQRRPRVSTGNTATAACFDSPSQYEIAVAGKKLVGSAQVRKHGVILQHGSILLAFDPVKLASVFNLPLAARDELSTVLVQRATSLRLVLGRAVAYEEAVCALRQGLCATIAQENTTGILTAAEQSLAKELARVKYGCDSWTFRR